ncbi:MAG: hypothetical protein N4A61_05430 [Pelagimonas sp.]|nr:hypothetical protein [Pelagimonas sp.]
MSSTFWRYRSALRKEADEKDRVKDRVLEMLSHEISRRRLLRQAVANAL